MSTQDQRERDFLKEKQANFDQEKSIAWTELRENFGEKITKEHLETLAQICAQKMEGKVTPLIREIKRRKSMLIIWFHDNWEIVGEFVKTKISILDKEGEEVNETLKTKQIAESGIIVEQSGPV